MIIQRTITGVPFRYDTEFPESRESAEFVKYAALHVWDENVYIVNRLRELRGELFANRVRSVVICHQTNIPDGDQFISNIRRRVVEGAV